MILLKLPIQNLLNPNNQSHPLKINNRIRPLRSVGKTQSTYNSMSITTIAALTHHIKNDITELNLSSTLPTKLCRIQSLQRFHSLITLNLSNNNISKIQNLSHLRKLKTLSLQFNQIKVVQNLQKLANLQHLLLGYNAIIAISSNIVQNKKLKVIDMSYNMLESIDTIQPLFNLDIQSLCLQGNSVINRINYTSFMKTLIPSLILLDNKDINVVVESPFYGELNADEEVLVLRDTLNKLLEERNYLAEELQNLTSVSSPTKINLKDYLKYQSLKEGKSMMKNNAQYHSVEGKMCEQSNELDSEVRISTFSPIKHIEPKSSTYKNKNSRSFIFVPKKSRQQENVNIKQKISQQLSPAIMKQRQRMLQILQYWRGKLQQKVLVKKNQVDELHEYYAHLLKAKQKERESAGKLYLQQDLDEDEYDVDRKNINKSNSIENDKYKELFNRIKFQQQQIQTITSQIHSLSTLIQQISSLPLQQQLYKTIMMRVLFGNRDKQTSKRRQVNYRQLKRYLLSDYGLLNVVNDLGKVIFGEEGIQFNVQKIKDLKELTAGRCLMEMISQYKQQSQNIRKQKRQFQKQKQAYMYKLEQQSQELYDKWREFNQTKTSYELQKGSQLRYQSKLMQQKQVQLQLKLQQLSKIHSGKLKSIQQHKQQLQNEIYILEEKISELQTQRQRSEMELHQIQQHLSTAASHKQELLNLDAQLSHLKKLIFTKQNTIDQKAQTLKHLSLEEEIANERVEFLEKKCAQRMLQINKIEQQERKLSQKLSLLKQQQKQKSLSLSTLTNQLQQLHQQQSSILKQTQRHRQNLTLFQQKLANLSQLQTHKKKSLQQLQLQNAELKTVSQQLNEKNYQLQQIIIQKEETIHAYITKINQHKMQLQTYTDLNKNMQALIQRQAELKRSILELQIHNGNLLDLQNQLLRDNKTHQQPFFNLKPHW